MCSKLGPPGTSKPTEVNCASSRAAHVRLQSSLRGGTRAGHHRRPQRHGRPRKCVFLSHKTAWRVSERSRAPPPTSNRFFFKSRTKSRAFTSTRTARTYARTSARPSSARLSARPPPCLSFASRSFVCCVVAKATVEVGLASPLSSPRVVVTRRARRLDRRCRQCWYFRHRLRDAHCFLSPFG